MNDSSKELTVTVNIDAIELLNEPKEDLGQEPTSISLKYTEETTDLLEIPKAFRIIFFDYKSDYFQKNKKELPKGYSYIFVQSLAELNECLKSQEFQIVAFNYDVIPKAINQMSAEIKKKLPTTKVMIMSRAIAPEKAEKHAQTASGAACYYQFPFEARSLDLEFSRLHDLYKDSEPRD